MVLVNITTSVFIGAVVSNTDGGEITYCPTYVKFGTMFWDVWVKGLLSLCDLSHWVPDYTTADEVVTVCVDSTDRSDWPS